MKTAIYTFSSTGNSLTTARRLAEKLGACNLMSVTAAAKQSKIIEEAEAVAKRMDQLLKTRGQKLSLALGMPMPGNSFMNEPHVDQEYLEKQDENVEKLLDPIVKREVCDYSESGVLSLTPVAYPNNFRGITAEDSCIGCGTCAKVCPMNNIVLKDGKACIGDNCSTCLGCFHWCPVEAIYMSQQENIARRKKYRHPEVTVEDFYVM